jgi:hypothetical protein
LLKLAKSANNPKKIVEKITMDKKSDFGAEFNFIEKVGGGGLVRKNSLPTEKLLGAKVSAFHFFG